MSNTLQLERIDFRAAGWTVGIHALLLLLFLFITYQPPEIETIDELGMEVNLGTSIDGYGTNQPMSLGQPAPDNSSTANLSSSSTTNLPTDIVESTDEDAPAINTNRNSSRSNTNANNNRRGTNTNTSNANNTPKPKARYVYGGSTGEGGNNSSSDNGGGSEGNTSGNGDRGVPGGTPGADNYEGTPGSGNGISHTLDGRSIVAFPPRDAEFKEGGKVTVRITVNKLGTITNRRIVSSSSPQLNEIALKKVSLIRFNKSDTAPEEQFGNITFVFKTRS